MLDRCKAALIFCIDYRFDLELGYFLQSRQLSGRCDEIRAAGSVRNLVRPEVETDRDFILRQISKSVEYHNIEILLLINHMDCLSYGRRAAFESEAAERRQHTKDLHEGRQFVKERFPHIEVETVLANIHEVGRVSFDIV